MRIGSWKWSAECFNIIVKLLLIAFDYMIAVGIYRAKKEWKDEKREAKANEFTSIWTGKGNHINDSQCTEIKTFQIILLRGIGFSLGKPDCIVWFQYVVHIAFFQTNTMVFEQRSDVIWCTCIYRIYVLLCMGCCSNICLYLNGEYNSVILQNFWLDECK